MKTSAASLTFLPVAVALVIAGRAAAAEPRPLVRAHAHNDYEHPRPLLDALDQGFTSVEADIWLVDGQLRVAHDLKDARADRTLQRLYLDPLQDRSRQNAGRVFRHGPPVTLLVDVKSEATNTYVALRQVLSAYRPILTVFRPGRIETNAVTVIISGNRARGLMESETERLSAYDGRLTDLEAPAAPELIPLISDNWRLHFRWKGTPEAGPLSADERDKLRTIVQRVHRAGARLRFWGMPDSPLVWRTLDEAGVDLINTDQLEALARFFNETRPSPARPAPVSE